MELSDDSILALYMHWRAARVGATQVLISNKALQKQLKLKRVNERRLKEFAERFKTVFPHHFPHKELREIRGGADGLPNCVVLCFNETDDVSVKAKRIRFDSIPDQATINKELN